MDVDFIPRRNAAEITTKIYDNGPTEINLVLLHAIRILEMMPGMNPDYPLLGAKPILLELTNFMEDDGQGEIESITSRLTDHLAGFLNKQIEFTIGPLDSRTGIRKLTMTLDNVPGGAEAEIHVTNSYAKIMNPKYIENI